ncbi:MAG: hypothetical protein O6943_04570, partial [Bacteroidetes bacterium]|nr:hypothetical protein [Bacteroidota bacterium]
LAIIFSHTKNKEMSVGFYDPQSPIRIKMIHFDSGAIIYSSFFSEKIQDSFILRKELLKTQTNSYRLLFGENDSDHPIAFQEGRYLKCGYYHME